MERLVNLISRISINITTLYLITLELQRANEEMTLSYILSGIIIVNLLYTIFIIVKKDIMKKQDAIQS